MANISLIVIDVNLPTDQAILWHWEEGYTIDREKTPINRRLNVDVSSNFAVSVRNCLTSALKYIVMQIRNVLL